MTSSGYYVLEVNSVTLLVICKSSCKWLLTVGPSKHTKKKSWVLQNFCPISWVLQSCFWQLGASSSLNFPIKLSHSLVFLVKLRKSYINLFKKQTNLNISRWHLKHFYLLSLSSPNWRSFRLAKKKASLVSLQSLTFTIHHPLAMWEARWPNG